MHIFGPGGRFTFDPASKYVSGDRPPDESFALHDRLGIDRAVFVSGAGYGPDRAQLEYVLERHSDRLVGVALLPPDTAPETFRHLGALCVRAIRFVNPAHGGRVPPICMTNAHAAADSGWHIHYYPFRTELADGVGHLLALPGDIVLDHFAHIPAAGGADQRAMDALYGLLDTGRFWVKLSGPMRICTGSLPYPSVTPIARRLVAHRPDRLLWGSDWPHLNMAGRVIPNDAALLDLMLDWVANEDTRNRILAANPEKLFG